LTGAGGAGKTRLALAVSGELGRGLRYGAVAVDLAPISDPALVATTVAQSLGLRETPGRRAIDALAAHFAGRETLLVLDNFEQVLPAASDVSDLLERAPKLQVLVTSRAPLRVPQERTYAVPPLEVPDLARHLPLERLRRVEAVRLFIDRAQRSRADFRLSEVNAEAVAELCVRLDGLPLALELAAARIKMLSARAIVDRLGRRLDLLRTDASGVPDRHRTLRSAIEWSYELLGEDEQQLFASLAVFTGGFTLDGAEAVAEIDGFEVLDGVESLLEGSLLSGAGTVADEPRFRMLETIRDYAAERLAERPDANDVRRRHASFYLVFAETAEPELRGPRQVAWLARVDADLDNLRSALAWATETNDVERGLRAATALWRFCQMRGLLAEGRRWLERPLTLEAENVQPHARADALAAAGRLAFMQGDYEAARRYLEQSVPAHRRLGELLWAAQALGVLGLISRAQGDDTAALRLIEQSVELARSSRDWWAQSQALACLGDLQLARGMRGKARLALEEALRASREASDLRGIGRMLPSLGLLALVERDHELARLRFEEGLVVQNEVGDTWNISRSLGYLGLVARESGDRAGARRLFREALAMQAETDDRPGIATTLELIAELAVADGRPRRAARLTSAAQILREDVGEFPLLPLAPEKPDAEALRAALGAEAFEEAWAKGRSMMLTEVITYALSDEEGEADLELVRRAGGDG
jgi:predicted ATPase